jgi:hypothetical protein
MFYNIKFIFYYLHILIHFQVEFKELFFCFRFIFAAIKEVLVYRYFIFLQLINYLAK